MIHEKSCGAVVFYLQNSNEPLYLLEHMVLGHIAMCKGHVEDGEDEHTTALREIREETSLSVSFIPGFRITTSYSPSDGIDKEVVNFLARTESTAAVPQPEEVAALSFHPLQEALSLLTYESDRSILMEADSFLRNHLPLGS